MEGNGLTSPEVGLPRGLLVIFGEHSGAARMLDLTAGLSLRGPLYLLDCGNRSNMYRVARTLRTLTDDPVAVMRNIRLSRAFTCYQVVALLEKVAASPSAPVLVLDLLDTFMDESVQLRESSLLFDSTLQHLLTVGQTVPVVVSAKPLLTLSAPRFGLLEQLKAAAAEVWEETALYPARPAASTQLPLLPEY
jgi:hypothetical protein